MMHISKYTLAVAGLLLLSMAPTTASAAPFGNPGDIAYAKKLWGAMKDNRLVGANSLHPMPYETSPPHGNIVETMDGHINFDNRHAVVIVKKNYGKKDETTLEQVADNPDKYMTSITVMFKREKGYDPENKDWFWAKFLPDGSLDTNPKKMKLAGRVAKGAEKGCIACHSLAPGGDMVYVHNRYAE